MNQNFPYHEPKSASIASVEFDVRAVPGTIIGQPGELQLEGDVEQPWKYKNSQAEGFEKRRTGKEVMR